MFLLIMISIHCRANKSKNEIIRRELSLNSNGKVSSTWKVNGAQVCVVKLV